MKNYSIKKSCIIILFAGLVMLAVLNIHSITQGVALVGNILMPFWIGIIMAFILNMLMVPINNFLAARVFKKNKKPVKVISIVLSYLTFILIIVALLAFVIPELTNSIATFIGNWGTYIEELQKMVSKRKIRFLNTHSIKVRNALRARGENWRMARQPISQDDMKKMIEESIVSLTP